MANGRRERRDRWKRADASTDLGAVRRMELVAREPRASGREARRAAVVRGGALRGVDRRRRFVELVVPVAGGSDGGSSSKNDGEAIGATVAAARANGVAGRARQW